MNKAACSPYILYVKAPLPPLSQCSFVNVSLASLFVTALIWIYLSAPMFVFNVAVSGWASCSVFSEKGLLADNRRRRMRRRKRRLRPKQVSMSHLILRLLTSLIHYCCPSSIMDEQVQCHMAPEPMLPMLSPSTTHTIATAAALTETSTALERLYLLFGLWPT